MRFKCATGMIYFSYTSSIVATCFGKCRYTWSNCFFYWNYILIQLYYNFWMYMKFIFPSNKFRWCCIFLPHLVSGDHPKPRLARTVPKQMPRQWCRPRSWMKTFPRFQWGNWAMKKTERLVGLYRWLILPNYYGDYFINHFMDPY